MSNPAGQFPPPPSQYQYAPPVAPQQQQPFGPVRSDALTPLDQPYYGIGFLAAWKRYWKKYAVFTGRASRSEFWFALLGNGIIGIAIYLLIGVPAIIIGTTSSDGDTFPVGAAVFLIIFGILFVAWALASIVPSYALLWRRLHDANLPGPLALLVLVPSLGGIWSIVTGCLPSNPLGARFDER